MSNLEVVRSVYHSFAKGDIPSVLSALSPEIRWTEALGGPYGGVYIGPDAVLEGVFMKLGSDWDGFAAVPAEFVSEGDTVVALGQYSATHKDTGKSFNARFAHVWKVSDGKVVEFQQHTDTHVHREPMQA
ncbi:MAG: nuclear transport factor 2 family protein [Candidatus Wenzhouxiangella sp. M2_3B_020]